MSKLKAVTAILKTNVLKTIWFNWRMLPFSQAWKLPIYLYGKTVFRSLSGSIVIEGKVHPGMIKIGKRDYYTATSLPLCIWTIRGTIVFTGRINFLMGSYVLVSDNATLKFGKYPSFCGSNVKFLCFDRIMIGDGVEIAWDCQIMDTSFHYVEDITKGDTPPLTDPVIIGDRVWIGNRTTIMKGSIIPDDTIVASNSLVNKNFSRIGPYCLLAGCPANVKDISKKRVWDSEREKEFDNLYDYSRTHI